ncbi:helix-turn-helix domain-containing protein, partial [Vibrio sp. 1727]|uniref:helix-turn-helix domain-containing protein n=1 Tax=Vibrio sp. 1727 TaxID=3074572 RepID=UPI002965D2B9
MSISGFRPLFKKGRKDGKEKPRRGRSPFLTSEQKEQLSQDIKDKTNDTQGGRLTVFDIHAYIMKKFGKHYRPDSIYYLLDHMGFSWITSRSKHPKQPQQAQDDFKKFKI